MRTRLWVLTLVLTLMMLAPALAYDMSGVWASTSGSTIIIPYSTSNFDLIVKHSDGKKFHLHAHWAHHKVGREFLFVNEYGRPATVTIDPADSNRVILTTSVGTYAWQRVRQ